MVEPSNLSKKENICKNKYPDRLRKLIELLKNKSTIINNFDKCKIEINFAGDKIIVNINTIEEVN